MGMLTCAAAILLREHLDAAMAVTGLLAISMTSVIFPVAVYVELVKPSAAVRWPLIALAVLSGVFAVMGTVSTVREELHDMQKLQMKA